MLPTALGGAAKKLELSSGEVVDSRLLEIGNYWLDAQ
jgi:hypothetical protein